MDFFGLDLVSLQKWLQAIFGSSHEFVSKLFLNILLVLPVFILRKMALRKVPLLISELSRRYAMVRTINFSTWIVTGIIVVVLWLEGGKSLATYVGIISAGLAVALKAPLLNIAGFIFISIKRPFSIGDRIEIDMKTGDVVDQGLFNFSLLEVGQWCDNQSTGRITYIPNGQAFTMAIHNFTAGFRFIWNEVRVLITFECNWKEAKKILHEIAKKNSQVSIEEAEKQIRDATQKFYINWRYLTPIVWTEVAESGVSLTLRYLCDARSKRSSENNVWEDVLDAFSKRQDIQFAYPTSRFYRKSDSPSDAPSPTEPPPNLPADIIDSP